MPSAAPCADTTKQHHFFEFNIDLKPCPSSSTAIYDALISPCPFPPPEPQVDLHLTPLHPT